MEGGSDVTCLMLHVRNRNTRTTLNCSDQNHYWYAKLNDSLFYEIKHCKMIIMYYAAEAGKYYWQHIILARLIYL